MRTLQQITKSLIKSYNNKTAPNFVDIRDLDKLNNLEELSIRELKELRRKITFILEDKCYESTQKFLAKIKS